MDLRFECKHCLKKFKSKDSRHHHLFKYHGYTPISYKCEHCPKSFKYKHNYMTHLSEGHEVTNMRFECGQCTSSFKYSHHLVQHMRMVHDPDHKSYKCKECSKTFERRDGYVQHLKLHAPTVTLHRCELCHRMYRSKAGLKLHVNMNHNENFQRSQCPMCPSDFKWVHHLKQHMSKVHFRPDDTVADVKHRKGYSNRCAMCMVPYAGKMELLMHLKNYHKLDVDIYKCCQCTEVFNLKEPLQLHLERHQARDDLTHKCEQCYPVINPKLYVDSTSTNELNLRDPEYGDEITDFEVCIMEHPELRRVIKYKMRHMKKNDAFFSKDNFEVAENYEDSDEKDEWNSTAESNDTEDNFDGSEANFNTSPQLLPEIRMDISFPERDETRDQVLPPLIDLPVDTIAECNDIAETPLNISLPEDVNSSASSLCEYSCTKCRASFATRTSLSVHDKVSHGSNTVSPDQRHNVTPIESNGQECTIPVDSLIQASKESLNIVPPIEGHDEASSSMITLPESNEITAETSPMKQDGCSIDSLHKKSTPLKEVNEKELLVQLHRLKEYDVQSNTKQKDKRTKYLQKHKIIKAKATIDDSSPNELEKKILPEEKLIFKCEICSKSFTKKSNLEEHLDSHKPKTATDVTNTIEPKLLRKRPKDMNVIAKKYSRIRKKSISIKCKQCNLTFNAPVEVARHVRLIHMRPINADGQQKSVKKMRCKYCSKVFGKSHALARHTRLAHYNKLNKIAFKTRASGTIVSKKPKNQRSETINHKVNGESNLNAQINNTEIPTAVVQAVQESAQEQVNVNVSDDKTPNPEIVLPEENPSDNVFDCGKCKLFFASKLKLLRHISEKHMNIRDVNSKKYAVLKSAQKNDKSYHCIACKQMFAHESEFVQHMKTEHRHKCGICSIAFVRKEKLENHLATQHKDRPQRHKCDECNAVFYLEASLAKHMDTKHKKSTEEAGEKQPQLVTKAMERVMHKCIHCSALFPLRESLQRHIQLEHDVGSLHKCGECTAVFNDIEEFKEHLQIEHVMQM